MRARASAAPRRARSRGASIPAFRWPASVAHGAGRCCPPWVFWFIGQFGDACAASEMVIDLSLDRARFRTRHRETSLNQRRRKAVNLLLEAGPDSFEGGLNTRKYVSLMKTSRATAFRELDALVGAGLLVQVGQGRATRYFVKIDGWYTDGKKGKGDGCSLSTVTGGEGDPFSHFPFRVSLPPHSSASNRNLNAFPARST